MQEINATEARKKLDNDPDCRLLDVREGWELDIVAIKTALHIPMQDVPDRLSELDPGHDLIIMCHHGNRSRVVARFLEQNGYPRVINLQGGIDAWARDVDNQLAEY